MTDHEGIIGAEMTAMTAAEMLVYVLIDPKTTKHDRERLAEMWNADVKRNADLRGR